MWKSLGKFLKILEFFQFTRIFQFFWNFFQNFPVFLAFFSRIFQFFWKFFQNFPFIQFFQNFTVFWKFFQFFLKIFQNFLKFSHFSTKSWNFLLIIRIFLDCYVLTNYLTLSAPANPA